MATCPRSRRKLNPGDLTLLSSGRSDPARRPLLGLQLERARQDELCGQREAMLHGRLPRHERAHELVGMLHVGVAVLHHHRAAADRQKIPAVVGVVVRIGSGDDDRAERSRLEAILVGGVELGDRQIDLPGADAGAVGLGRPERFAQVGDELFVLARFGDDVVDDLGRRGHEHNDADLLHRAVGARLHQRQVAVLEQRRARLQLVVGQPFEHGARRRRGRRQHRRHQRGHQSERAIHDLIFRVWRAPRAPAFARRRRSRRASRDRAPANTPWRRPW